MRTLYIVDVRTPLRRPFEDATRIFDKYQAFGVRLPENEKVRPPLVLVPPNMRAFSFGKHNEHTTNMLGFVLFDLAANAAQDNPRHARDLSACAGGAPDEDNGKGF